MTNEQSEHWLSILVQANPKHGLDTQAVANKVGCSRRTVQVVVKAYKEQGRRKFFKKLNGQSALYVQDSPAVTYYQPVKLPTARRVKTSPDLNLTMRSADDE